MLERFGTPHVFLLWPSHIFFFLNVMFLFQILVHMIRQKWGSIKLLQFLYLLLILLIQEVLEFINHAVAILLRRPWFLCPILSPFSLTEATFTAALMVVTKLKLEVAASMLKARMIKGLIIHWQYILLLEGEGKNRWANSDLQKEIST